jgi:hypothetical protein
VYKQQTVRSPVCECIGGALTLYTTASTPNPKSAWNNASLAERFDHTKKALQACLSSQQFVPKINFVFKDRYDTKDINTRKVISRGGLLLTLALSVLFTAVYNNINFAEWSNPSIIIANVILIALAIIQLLAAGAGGVNFSGITSISALLILPAIVLEFVLIEPGWSYMYGRRRTIFTHPYVAATTLSVLLVLGAVENGVFSWNEIFSRILTAHTLSLAYSAAIFFVTFGCGEWEKNGEAYKQGSDYVDSSQIDGQTLGGFFLLFATVFFIGLTQIIPIYPTTPELNFMWFAPWAYVLILFGTIVMVGQVTKANKDGEWRLHAVAYMGSLGGSLLVGGVFVYYMLRLWHLGFGDTILSNSGRVLSSINFALKLRTVSFPIGASVPLYVIP